MQQDHPALVAAHNSWRCVQAKDKEGWLALMADDICMEDPIGVGPTNPSGKGWRGKAEVAEFYDKSMAESTIVIETHESRVANASSEGRLCGCRGARLLRSRRCHRLSSICM